MKDILIAAIDGLAGFPEAIASVFPKTQSQLGIVRHGAGIAALRVLEGA